MKMKPTTVKATIRGEDTEVEIRCRHENQWPPVHAKFDASFEAQRAAGDIDEVKYQQLKVWEKVCGLFEMKAEKCVTCHLCEVVHRKNRLSVPEFKRTVNATVEGA